MRFKFRLTLCLIAILAAAPALAQERPDAMSVPPSGVLGITDNGMLTPEFWIKQSAEPDRVRGVHAEEPGDDADRRGGQHAADGPPDQLASGHRGAPPACAPVQEARSASIASRAPSTSAVVTGPSPKRARR